MIMVSRFGWSAMIAATMARFWIVVVMTTSRTNISTEAFPWVVVVHNSNSNSNARRRHGCSCQSVVAVAAARRKTTRTTRTTFLSASSSYSSQNTNVVVDIRENTPRDISSMQQWAAACGVQTCNGFELIRSGGGDDDDHDDISVVTTQNLAVNDPILFVPNQMILSAIQTRNEIGPLDEVEERLVAAKAQDHIPYFYLFVKILQQYQLGNNASPWFPWLNSLPRYFTNGASMTQFCFDCLPPLAGYLAQMERIKLGQFVFLLDSCVSDDLIRRDIKRNHPLVKWAFNVVYTRAFETNKNKNNNNQNPTSSSTSNDYCITPMADYFNHCGGETEVSIQYDDNGNCMAYANQNIPAGSPLRIQYADPTNPSHLLARYGFVDKTTTPATFCKIMISQPSLELVNMGVETTQHGPLVERGRCI